MTIHTGDCLHILPTLAAESVQCCVTSPPYFGLRSYLPDGHADKSKEVGSEFTPAAYVEKMVAVFREVRRVLKPNSTLWLNLGDSFCSTDKWGGGKNGNTGKQTVDSAGGVPSWACRAKRDPIEGIKPKDLIGIPWRVAFALQQPYQRPLCIKNEIDRAWLAAIIDGEGCISIRRHDSHSNADGNPRCQDGFIPFICVGNNDRELLDRCQEITGYGTVGVKDRPHTDGRGIHSRRIYYGWRLDGNKAIEVIRAIYPFLIAKKRQAILCYNLDLSNKNGKNIRGNGALPSDEQERRVSMKAMVNALNQRQPITLPSWMIEPKPEIEPGWWLRSDIIWSKPNPMPESVSDRCTKSHEYLFMLTKSANYYYDNEAIKEPAKYAGLTGQDESGFKDPKTFNGKNGTDKQRGHSRRHAGFNDRWDAMSKTEQCSGLRNKRDVWTIATESCAEAHFAVMPTALVEPCILAGSKPADTILDPFAGSGTVGVVCAKWGREFIGCELNPAYVQIAERRIAQAQSAAAMPLLEGNP